MAYHTSHCVKTTVCACQVLFQWESLFFVIVYETRGAIDFLCFPWQPRSAQYLQRPDTSSICIFVLLEARRSHYWQNRAVCFAPWNDTLLAALKSRFEFELWNLRIWICNVNCHKTGALSAAKGRNFRFAERERPLSVRAWAWRRALPKLPSSLAPKTVSLKDAIQQRAAIASQLERRHSGDVTTQWPPRRKPFAFNVRA